MSKLVAKKSCFQYYPYARYATDVMLQQGSRPADADQGGKLVISSRYHLHVWKNEVSVLLDGLEIYDSDPEPGAVADIKVLQKRLQRRKSFGTKCINDLSIADGGELADVYENERAILFEKGYTGVRTFLRRTIPTRKPENGWLSPKNFQQNKNIFQEIE